MLNLASRVDRQAAACESLGSPMYAHILSRVADDIRSGRPVGELLAPAAGLPEDAAVPLRLMGGVHALVLQRRAPELAMYYPSVGGSALDDDGLWRAFREVVDKHSVSLAPWLLRIPQTNEVGRSAPLLGALRLAAARTAGQPVRLFEIGASSGLNLLADQLPIGPGELIDSPMPEASGALRIVERLGVDLNPIDATTPEGRLLLSAYVWADQLDRFERLKSALQLALRTPVRVTRGSADGFVASLVLKPGHLTVLWHSVMWQYLGDDERLVVLRHRDRLAESATSDAPFVHISFESDKLFDPKKLGYAQLEVVLRTWPSGESQVLGHAPAHGVPVRWNERVIARSRAS